MTSLIAIPLVVLWIVLGVVVLLERRAGNGGHDRRFAYGRPVLAAMGGVLAAGLAGWLLAVAVAHL